MSHLQRSLGAPALLAVTSALLLLGAPTASAEEVNPSEDVFNQQTFNEVVDGREVGFSTRVTRSRSYDTTNYTFDPDFAGEEKARTGCGGGSSFARGGKTAWVRFVPAVKGRFVVSASTGYDVLLFAYRTPLARGAKSFNQADLVTLTCNDASKGSNEINMGIASNQVVPGQAILLQTAGFCDNGDANTCDRVPPKGGPTTLTVEFVPDDEDGDGVPDTFDACPTVGGSEANGCPPPDSDGDGVADRDDQCVNVRGDAPTGCPPDSDGDGVADRDDQCLNVRGAAPTGCPPDSDGDGVADRDDQCANVRGVAPTGCPPDSDGDGVANEVDRCPFQFGTNPGGCPDPDGDGVVNRADICPTVKGIAGDGCPDSDEDGVSDRADKCKAERGTGIDGCPQALNADVRGLWEAFPRATKARTLTVRTRAGAKVELRCRGRGCRFKTKRFTADGTKQDLRRYLPRRRELRIGVTLEIRVTAPAFLGTYVRYRMRKSKAPSKLNRCITASGGLRACP